MRTKTKVLGATAAALLIAGVAATVSVATGGDDRPLEGADLDHATDAALAHTDGGTVVEAEFGDDGAGYEVGVRLDDGSVVELQLDGRFVVVTGSTADDGGDGTGTEEGSDEGSDE